MKKLLLVSLLAIGTVNLYITSLISAENETESVLGKRSYDGLEEQPEKNKKRFRWSTDTQGELLIKKREYDLSYDEKKSKKRAFQDQPLDEIKRLISQAPKDYPEGTLKEVQCKSKKKEIISVEAWEQRLQNIGDGTIILERCDRDPDQVLKCIDAEIEIEEELRETANQFFINNGVLNPTEAQVKEQMLKEILQKGCISQGGNFDEFIVTE